MNYFKTFNDWNTKYKDLSVSAEQYTIIKNILTKADQEIKNQQLEVIDTNREKEKNARIIQVLIASIAEQEDKYNNLLLKYRIISIGTILIAITYGSILYFLFK